MLNKRQKKDAVQFTIHITLMPLVFSFLLPVTIYGNGPCIIHNMHSLDFFFISINGYHGRGAMSFLLDRIKIIIH